MQELAKTILKQTDLIAQKSRFALFTQPPPLAVGDNSYYSKTIRIIHQLQLDPRAENGKPLTKPRNIITTPSKSGKVKSSYFNVPSSIYIGDTYQSKQRVHSTSSFNSEKRRKLHQNTFIPASGRKTLATSAYEYIQQKSEKQIKKIIKDQNGRVKTQPKNITANLCSKIQSEFMKYPVYQNDPFDRVQEIQRQNKKLHRLKIKQSFKPSFGGNKLFAKNSQVYGENNKIYSPYKQKNQQKNNKIKQFQGVNHEMAFFPPKSKCGYFSKYPQYIEVKTDSSRLIKGKRMKQIRQSFKPSKTSLLSRPTPSIEYNKINLKRQFFK